MQRVVRACALLVALAVPLVSRAGAVPPGRRVPQVVVQPGPLTTWLAANEPALDPATDQLAAQGFDLPRPSPYCQSLAFELLDDALDSLGVASLDPSIAVRACVFPAGSRAGGFAYVRFNTAGLLLVTTFDPEATLLSQHAFAGFPRDSALGLWLAGAAGTSWTVDVRNPGAAPRAVTYSLPRFSFGGYLVGFDSATGGDGRFSRQRVYVEYPCGLPARRSTWGRVKLLAH